MNDRREQFREWLQSDSPRCAHEWSKWDGTISHGERINEAQCDRINSAKRRIGVPYGLLTEAEISAL